MLNYETLYNTELPPLRVHHFLAWTVVAAAALSVSRFLNGAEQFSHFGAAPQFLVDYLLQTLSVTTLGFGIYWNTQRRKFFHEPGQGLLLLGSAGLVWHLSMLLMVTSFLRSNVDASNIHSFNSAPAIVQWMVIWSWAIFSALICFIYLMSAFFVVSVGRWRTFFLVLAGMEASFVVVIGIFNLMLSSISDHQLSSMEWLYEIFYYAPKLIAVVYLEPIREPLRRVMR